MELSTLKWRTIQESATFKCSSCSSPGM